MLLWPFNKYPGTDYETYNWEWILDTVKKLKNLVSAWNDRLSYLFDNAGIYTVIYDLINEHPEWASELPFVTPELYGYESGDVSSYLQQALNNDAGKWVLLLNKNYELADTINLTNGSKIKGLKNSRLTWTGIVNGTMIKSTAVQSNRAQIEHVYFTLNDAKTALEINANTWGASATVKNCRFDGGTSAIIKLLSAYNCIFKGCEFFTNGYIYLGPYDNEESNAETVANCNVFEDCYYSGTRGNSTRAFLLENARNTAFYSTAIEKSELAFEQDSNTKFTYVYSCWFENLGALYTGARIPYTNSNTYSGVSAFKQDHDEMDVYLAEGVQQYYKYSGSNTSPYNYLYTADNEIFDKLVTVYNNTADTYDTIYKRSTKELETHVPHNIRKVYAAGVDNLSIELDTFFKDGNVSAFYEITAYIYYDDTSRKLSRFTIFQHQASNYIKSGEEVLYRDGWGTANTATLTAAVAANGTFTLTSSEAVKFAYLIVETVPLGYRMNPTNT